MNRRPRIAPSAHYGDCWLSYKLMGKIKHRLYNYLKKTPEHHIDRRQKLASKLEKINQIRADMNIYMRGL